jgi:hypothetical protein
MPTVGEMKVQMRSEARRAAKRCDIMIGSLTTWPMCAMSAFLDACSRLNPVCEWSPIEDGSTTYNTCKDGEEFHLTEGLELYPFCQWCGRRVEVVEHAQTVNE